MGETGSRLNSAGESTGGEAVGGVCWLDGEGGENDSGEVTPDRGEKRNTSSSSNPRSSSTSLRRLLVLLAGGEMTSGDGGGEAGCCGLDSVGNIASRVGVQGFLPAGVATAGASVVVQGG